MEISNMEPNPPHNDKDSETFLNDFFYENIQAPKWIDFELPEVPVDDYEWFCKRPGKDMTISHIEELSQISFINEYLQDVSLIP